MKDIVMIANFCRDFSESDNGRFMYLCKELSKKHKVEIITSDFSHGKKKKKESLSISWPFKITFLHEPGYKKNVSIKRFYSHYSWGKRVASYLKKRRKPDLIYCAIPSLTAAMKASQYCRNKGVKFVIDIQDLWPEAFQMVFHVPVVSDIIFDPFKKAADKIYGEADEIVAVSQTYVHRALSVNAKCQRGHSVFLGTSLEIFDNNANNFHISKPKDKMWIGYCGTLGSSYDLTCVIDALAIVKEKKPNCVLVVMGDGPRRKEFEEYAGKKDVICDFTGRLAYPEMCGRLVACDIVVNPITHGAAQSIINKHADYAASGLPVINTQECEEYRKLVEEYNMGLNCRNSDPDDMAEKILKLLNDSELRCEMGVNARKCAEEKFDRKKSYLEITNIFKD